MGVDEADRAEQMPTGPAEEPQRENESPASPGRTGPAWVEDLAGPNDYWLTLTDAARVTRRQEVTIRRWVAAGTLPVRNRPLGLNKRTRHVRASDLAKLSPIVDASATISGAAAQIDLLSIPTQQAEILTQYQQMQQQLQDLTAQLVEAATQQQSQLENATRQIKSEVAERLQQADERQAALERTVSSLKGTTRHLTEQSKQLQEQHQGLHSRLEREAERHSELLETQKRHLQRIQRVEERAQRIEQLEQQQIEDAQDRARQHGRLDDLAKQLKALLSNVGQIETKLAEDIRQRRIAEKATEEHIERLSRDMRVLHEQVALTRQQTGELGQQLQDLKRDIQKAGSLSRALSQQLTKQGERFDQLTRQLLTLAAAVETRNEGRQQGEKPARPRRAKPAAAQTTSGA